MWTLGRTQNGIWCSSCSIYFGVWTQTVNKSEASESSFHVASKFQRCKPDMPITELLLNWLTEWKIPMLSIRELSFSVFQSHHTRCTSSKEYTSYDLVGHTEKIAIVRCLTYILSIYWRANQDCNCVMHIYKHTYTINLLHQLKNEVEWLWASIFHTTDYKSEIVWIILYLVNQWVWNFCDDDFTDWMSCYWTDQYIITYAFVFNTDRISLQFKPDIIFNWNRQLLMLIMQAQECLIVSSANAVSEKLRVQW